MKAQSTLLATHEDESQPMIAMEANGLVHGYGDVRVLNGATLRIKQGSVMGLIGRNGAGKSTLIQILLGLSQPQEGSAAIFNEPALRMSDASKARIGYVPQTPESLPWMTAEDMFAFIGRFYPRWDSDFVQRTLERWQLPTNRPMMKLSPGERQRVALVRALASSPDLLVLDEPAAALDPVARRDLLREIAERAAESGTTVLFSTHIVSDLERAASHVAFLHQGRIILQSELDALKECHARLHVPASAASLLTGRVPGELARRRHPNGSVSVLIVHDGMLPALAVSPGVSVDHLSLEDLFIEVVE